MTKGLEHYKEINWDKLFLLPSVCIESNVVFGYMGMVGKTDVTEIRFDFLGFHLTLYFWRREQTNEENRNRTC